MYVISKKGTILSDGKTHGYSNAFLVCEIYSKTATYGLHLHLAMPELPSASDFTNTFERSA